MSYAFPLDVSLDVPDGTTPTGDWMSSSGCTKCVIEYEITAIGATPTITVVVEATNLIDATNGAFDIVATSTETALGLFCVTIDTFPHASVRIRVSVNTNVTARARLTGTRGG